ncbi:type VI secretion system baseplate subunit TssF [Xenorhabdus sp. XENO-10]|uniref:Type VI secretion system baseplate subunit TssF n=1 Tax=Xenorhabdus yunnanensis TaxID=3025878 RepID=A0ABT5LJQ4_9GAMM|nr:type VI secretion system baseplate subunit TssF [Xenorhabdus yunnanensis]MDC9591189.1 type VI secretion system baseplate subunit TssF [Xenorhabdus yunnanensis]
MINNKESLYLQERAYLRELAQCIAKESPHLADFLVSSHDPEIARVFEAFALLISHVRDKLDDEFPEITHGILSRIWPLALCPIPPMTVVQFTPTEDGHQGSADIPIGTSVSASLNGQWLDFKTCRPLHIEPLMVQERVVKKTGTHSEIILTLCQTGPASSIWQSGSLTFFLGTDTERAAQLGLWLDQHICDVSLNVQGKQRKLSAFPYGWHSLFDDPLLPMPKSTYSGLQPLVEYYALPALYNFVTLDISNEHAQVPLNEDSMFELIFRFEGELPLNDVDGAFLLGCVPAIHLENQISPSILLETGDHSYLLPLGGSMRLFRLREIQVVQQPDNDEQRGTPYRWLPIEQFTPAGHFLDDGQQSDDFYYQLQTTQDFLGRTQHRLNFFDLTGKPAKNLPDIAISCHFIGYHEQALTLAQGAITVTQESSPSHLGAQNIIPVMTDYPPLLQENSGWPLLSCLSSPPVMLFATDSLKQFLRLFDSHTDTNRPLSRQFRQHIDGIVQVEERLTDRLRMGRPVRGYVLSLTLNPDCYRTPGEMYRFCRLINEAMACFISQSTFVMLEIFIPDSNKVLWQFGHVDGLRPDM